MLKARKNALNTVLSLALIINLASCVSTKPSEEPVASNPVSDTAPTLPDNPSEPVLEPIEPPAQTPVDDIPIVVSPVANSRIVIISDLNGSYGSTKYDSRITKAINKIIEIKPDLVLVTGDMVAGQKSGLNYKAMWKAFEAAVTIPLSNHGIALFVTPGNHDASAYSGFEGERKIYKEVWSAYQEKFLNTSGIEFVSMDNYPFYYSFKLNNTLFVSLDANTTTQITGNQKTWLLTQVNVASDVSHKVIFSHMPMHPVAQGRENDYIRDPGNELFKTLKANGVDLFLSGHHHAYYPAVYDGVRMVSQSCLGSGPRKMIGGNSVAEYSFTMVDLEDKIFVDAYKYPDYKTPVSRSSLVKQIKSPKGANLVRDDIALIKDYSIGDI